MKRSKKILNYVLLPVVGLTGIFCCKNLFDHNLQANDKTASVKTISSTDSIPPEYFSYADGYKTITGFAEGITIQKIRQEFYTVLEIPSFVERVENNAFSYMFDGMSTYVTTLKFGTNLKSIGSNAFEGCYGFTNELDFSKTKIKKIGNYAFHNCQCIPYINFIDDNGVSTIETIGASAFSNCYDLKEIILPKTLNEVGNYAFNYCKSVEKIDLTNFITPPKWLNTSSGIFRFCSTSSEKDDHPIYVRGKYVSLDKWKILLDKQHEDESSLEIKYSRATTKDDFIHSPKDWIYSADKVVTLETYQLSPSVDLDLIDVIIIPAEAQAFDTTFTPPPSQFAKFRLEFEEGSAIEAIQANNISSGIIGDLTLPNSICFIDQYCFQKSGTGTLTLPDNEDLIIKGRAFFDCEFSNVIFPPNIFSQNFSPAATTFSFMKSSMAILNIPYDQTSIPWIPDPIGEYSGLFYNSFIGATIIVNCNSSPDTTRQKIKAIEAQLSNASVTFRWNDKYMEPLQPLPTDTVIIDCDLAKSTPSNLFVSNRKKEIIDLSSDFIQERDDYSILKLPDGTTSISENVFSGKLYNEGTGVDNAQSWFYEPEFGLVSIKEKALAANSSQISTGTSIPPVEGLFISPNFPDTITEMDNPFGEYNYNLRVKFTMPRSLQSLTNFNIDATYVQTVVMSPNLMYFSGDDETPPLYSNYLHTIDFSEFTSFEQLYEVKWDKNVLELNNDVEPSGTIYIPHSHEYSDQTNKYLWQEALSRFCEHTDFGTSWILKYK